MGDMEFSMPVDVQTYDKKDVDDLFVDLVRRLSITGVDAYVTEVLEDEIMGVEAIQIRPSSGRGATGVLTRMAMHRNSVCSKHIATRRAPTVTCSLWNAHSYSQHS